MNRFGQLVYIRPMVWLGRRCWADRVVTLEVPGRRSGRIISYPLVLVREDGERFLVPMLGRDSGWVRNVRANQMHAVLRHGSSERVRLVELPSDSARCAPLLRRYLELAPGARPHFPVDVSAPLQAYEGLVGQYPIFQVVTEPSHQPASAALAEE